MKRFIGGQRRVVELAIADLTSPLEAGALRSEKPRSDHRIVILDSLRGAVALIVVAHHIWTIFNAEINEWLSAPIVSVYDLVQAQNHRAVMAFFILSGFTIAPLDKLALECTLVAVGQRCGQVGNMRVQLRHSDEFAIGRASAGREQ